MALGLTADGKAQEEFLADLVGIAGDEPRAGLRHVQNGASRLDAVSEVLDAGAVT